MNKFTILAGSSLLLLSATGMAQDVQGPADGAAPMETAPQSDPMAPESDTMSTHTMPADSTAMPATDATTDPAVPETDATAPSDAMAPSDTETMAEAQAFTDEQIASFAAAALQIQGLEGDASTSQEQAAEIVASSGLDASTFNAIGAAMQSDAEVAERVQLAAAELQGSAEPIG